MEVFVAPSADEMGKFQRVVQAFPYIWAGSILDVGCRSRKLEQALPRGSYTYFGIDIFPPADAVSNLEAGLPFPNKSFCTSVAMDVLEHTNDIHRAFSELCRVTKKYIVISLPNAYELKSRLRFLHGQPISGKYGLPLEQTADRHRWLFSLVDASRFCKHVGQKYGFRIRVEASLIGPRRAWGTGRVLTRFLPMLMTPTYLVLLAHNNGGHQ